MDKSYSPRMALVFGIMLTVDGAYFTITGRGSSYWGFPVAYWVRWSFLLMGIIICMLSIRALRRGEGKPKKYTEEDATRAEAELDAMYLRDHGELPEKPKTGKEL